MRTETNLNNMIVLLSKIIEEAKAQDETTAICITARLHPRWLAWILNRFYLPLEVSWCIGEYKDDHFVMSSTWSYGPKDSE